jgi:hypothetical protein
MTKDKAGVIVDEMDIRITADILDFDPLTPGYDKDGRSSRR